MPKQPPPKKSKKLAPRPQALLAQLARWDAKAKQIAPRLDAKKLAPVLGLLGRIP